MADEIVTVSRDHSVLHRFCAGIEPALLTGMKTFGMLIVASLVLVAGVEAQGRSRKASQGIPPGHMPPAGRCRVWYDGTPPGHQPAPTDCRSAERIAARDGRARVIYGSGASGDKWGRDGGDKWGRASEDKWQRQSNDAWNIAFKTGHNDGFAKGREDARDRDAYKPSSHSQYKDGNRGYDKSLGSKGDYQARYREGFEQGYREGFNVERSRDDGYQSKSPTTKEIGRAKQR